VNASNQSPTVVELPPVAYFDDARDALATSYTEVERVQWALKSYSDQFDAAQSSPANPPDDAYVGALYRFVDDLDTRAAELETKTKELRQLLVDVDCIGRDAEVRAEQSS
jgi:hypothetical protein